MTSNVTQTQPSMGDLMQHVTEINTVTLGNTIQGKVIHMSKNEVILDIENVGLGIVRGRELYNEEYLATIKLGETVEAIVVDLDNEKHMVELSFRAIGRDKIWSEVKRIFEAQETVEAKIRDANRGGFLVRIMGVDGFLPASLLSPTHAIKQVGVEDKSLLNQMKKYIGQSFTVKILSINEDGDTLIASEKAVSDELAKEKLSKYEVGSIVDGTVVGAVDFGVFIRFDEDLEGLVHISEIAWKKVEDPRIEYKIGQKVKAKIVEIDSDNRINLSIKQLLPNPWIEFVKANQPGNIFKGKVSKIVAYGAIIVNEDDIQGLCHVSQMIDQEIESAAQIHDLLKLGEEKEFTVLSLEADEKLYLTMLDFDTAQKIHQDMSNEPTEA